MTHINVITAYCSTISNIKGKKQFTGNLKPGKFFSRLKLISYIIHIQIDEGVKLGWSTDFLKLLIDHDCIYMGIGKPGSSIELLQIVCKRNCLTQVFQFSLNFWFKTNNLANPDLLVQIPICTHSTLSPHCSTSQT